MQAAGGLEVPEDGVVAVKVNASETIPGAGAVPSGSGQFGTLVVERVDDAGVQPGGGRDDGCISFFMGEETGV